MAARRQSSETLSRRISTLKTDKISEEKDDFVATTDRSALLGQYNEQMLKCKYGILGIFCSPKALSFSLFHGRVSFIRSIRLLILSETKAHKGLNLISLWEFLFKFWVSGQSVCKDFYNSASSFLFFFFFDSEKLLNFAKIYWLLGFIDFL